MLFIKASSSTNPLISGYFFVAIRLLFERLLLSVMKDHVLFDLVISLDHLLPSQRVTMCRRLPHKSYRFFFTKCHLIVKKWLIFISSASSWDNWLPRRGGGGFQVGAKNRLAMSTNSMLFFLSDPALVSQLCDNFLPGKEIWYFNIIIVKFVDQECCLFCCCCEIVYRRVFFVKTPCFFGMSTNHLEFIIMFILKVKRGQNSEISSHRC